MSEVSPNTIPSVETGHVGWAIFGDQHVMLVGENSPMTSVPFDTYVDTSMRPAVLKLDSGLINARANGILAEYARQGWNGELAGDAIDASTPHEWTFFLSTEDTELWRTFLPENSSGWGDQAWSGFFAGAEHLFSWSALDGALQEERDDLHLSLARPGNHEGHRLGSLLGTRQRKALIDYVLSQKEWTDVQPVDFLNKETWAASYLSFRHPSETISLPANTLKHGTRLDVTDANRSDLFKQYWSQKKNGDYVCQVRVENKRLIAGSDTVILQARKAGDVNGRPVFELIFDTSDMSGDLPQNASVGMISGLQLDLWQLFIDQMRSEQSTPLFVPQGHISMSLQDPDNAEKLNLEGFFKQPDMVPVFLCADGHHRDIAYAAGVWNIMTPSTLDTTHEYMTVDLSYDAATGDYVITQEYKSVIPDRSTDDPEVTAAVDAFATELSTRHYASFSSLSSRPVPTIVNTVFRKGAIDRDTDFVELQNLRDDLKFIQRYQKFLETDSNIPPCFVKLVQYHTTQLEVALADEALLELSPEAKNHAQALQFYISQTLQDSKAAEFMLRLGETAATKEGPRRERRGGWKTYPVADVPDQNMFRWNPETGVVIRD